MDTLYRPPAPEPQDTPLGALALLAALKRNPLECWARRHFEELIIEGGLPFGHVVLVHEPAAIRRVLMENAANYHKDRLQRRVLSAGLADGLLSAEGEAWRTQRRVAAPVFAHRTVKDFAPAMMAAARALAARWPEEDGELDIAVEMRRVTLDVLERTIFSDGFGRAAEEIRKAMTTYFSVIGRISPLDILGVPDFIPRLGQWRVRATLRFFERAIDDLITARRARLAGDPQSAPDDVLTRLIEAADGAEGASLTETEVRSNILTFFSAGHETTANALTWAIFLLSQSPRWLERVEREAMQALSGPDAGMSERLPVTRAVVEEAIRLYPPIAAISRVALGPDDLAGVKVRRGSLVVISPYVLHRHRALWEAPDVFDPGRFVGGARTRIDRFAYLPFGVGPRICVGQAFALQEATVVLANIVHGFTLELSPDQAVWPLLSVTLRPADGLNMRLRRKVAAMNSLRAAS
ncbi:MAG TPA: cytochrome P450 [Caulobacteraceae bacterium]|jgi:cytochrome P450